MALNFKSSPLPHFRARPENIIIDTLVVHSLHALGAADEFDPLACIKILDEHEVSAHYLIDRAGIIWRLVEEEARARHAGVAKMCFPEDQRENLNDFSLGVELIGSPQSGFTDQQYESLTALTLDLCSRYPLKNIVGHEHIAPGRKTDPGPLFNWLRFAQRLAQEAATTLDLKFPLNTPSKA